jgi:hypothetical protein
MIFKFTLCVILSEVIYIYIYNDSLSLSLILSSNQINKIKCKTYKFIIIIQYNKGNKIKE